MEHHDWEHILGSHSVKPTANRIVILRTLEKAGRPLSMAELEGMIGTIDKSIISRTLTLFREHHVVHVIEAGGDSVRYELCRSRNHDEHDDMHVHFYCERCQRTFCIDSPIPQVELPNGYITHTINYMIRGVCPECAGKH